jgi:hypothetical protein
MMIRAPETARRSIQIGVTPKLHALKIRCPDILDFEASGFGLDSYPIEVGYALGNGERFCMLIKPHASWQHWDNNAQAIHGITQATLAEVGMEIPQVCQELNRRLKGRTLYSDAWVFDKAWLNRLFEAAGLTPEFHLHAIENIQTEMQHLIWDGVRDQLLREVGLERHRASADAQFIQQLFARTQAHAEFKKC